MTDPALFCQAMDDWIEEHGKPDVIVSGGARGADTLAEQWAQRNSVPCQVFKPDWKRHGKAAGILRNTDIVNNCTHMLAFPSRRGKGTQDSIKKARRAEKDVHVTWID